MRAVLREQGTELGDDISLAATLRLRLKGLLGKDRLGPGKGLLIRPCTGIHTFFMKFPIDAVFLDKENRIIALFRSLPPNRLTAVYRKAYSVLELPAGAVDLNTAVGDRIDFT